MSALRFYGMPERRAAVVHRQLPIVSSVAAPLCAPRVFMLRSLLLSGLTAANPQEQAKPA